MILSTISKNLIKPLILIYKLENKNFQHHAIQDSYVFLCYSTKYWKNTQRFNFLNIQQNEIDIFEKVFIDIILKRKK